MLRVEPSTLSLTQMMKSPQHGSRLEALVYLFLEGFLQKQRDESKAPWWLSIEKTIGKCKGTLPFQWRVRAKPEEVVLLFSESSLKASEEDLRLQELFTKMGDILVKSGGGGCAEVTWLRKLGANARSLPRACSPIQSSGNSILLLYLGLVSSQHLRDNSQISFSHYLCDAEPRKLFKHFPLLNTHALKILLSPHWSDCSNFVLM